MRISEQEFSKKLANGKRTVTNFRKTFQELALAAIAEVVDNGNTERCTKVIQAMEGSKDQSTMVAYFSTYASVRYVKASEKKPARCKIKDAPTNEKLAELFGEAQGINWWTLNTGKGSEAVDFDPVKDYTDTMAYLQRHAAKAREGGYTELAQCYERILESQGINPETKGKELKERVGNVIPVQFTKPDPDEDQRPAAQVAEAREA